MKKTNNFIKKNLLLIVTLIIFFSQTMAYSAIAGTMNISGLGYARIEQNIRITNFSINNTTSSSISQYEEFNKTQTQSDVVLPNADSTITYNVEITNYGSQDMGIYSITGLPDNLTYQISNYTMKTKLCSESNICNQGAKKTIQMTIKYRSYNSSSTLYRLNLSFEFKPMYQIKYNNLINNSFPSNIMEGETLNINVLDSSNYLQVKMGNNYLGYSDYTYQNKNLIINNITDHLEISSTKVINIYNYTGDYQTFTAPETGIYKIELWGASGGSIKGIPKNASGTTTGDSITYSGGRGGYTSGKIELAKGTTLYLYVGGTPSQVNNTLVKGGTTTGGYNGGGDIALTPTDQSQYGAPGGGATDVRLTAGDASNFDSLKSRIMVAGGGGGANYRNHGYGQGNGGAGGGIEGYPGESAEGYNCGNNSTYQIGTGGTQTSGGYGITYNCSTQTTTNTIAYGKFGGLFNESYYLDTSKGTSQSGGGGGYFGGSYSAHGGAGGGSSFVSGHTGCLAIAEESTESNIISTTERKHYSNYIFDETTIIDGNGYRWYHEKNSTVSGMPTHEGGTTMLGNSGNGFAKISLLNTVAHVEDNSGNNYIADGYNVTQSSEGHVYNGVDSYTKLPNNIDVSLPATYSIKFKTPMVGNQILFGHYKTFAGLGTFNSNTNLIVTIGSNDESRYPFIYTGEPNTFYTMDLLYESLDNIRLFVNGVEITQRTTTANKWNWDMNESYLGRRSYSNSINNTYFKGTIEYFMIYDDLLTETEILQNYNATDPNARITDNLKLYYYFK